MEKFIVNDEICKGCAVCTTACPKGILEMSKDKINGKGYNPVICTNQESCTSCSLCATVCPDVAITIKAKN